MNNWIPGFDELTGKPGEWRNWGRTASAYPSYVSRPGTIENVVKTIERARERGNKVKAVGAGHSFTAVAAPRDVALAPDHQGGLETVDVERKRVTLRAGTRLYDVPALLEPYGLAMPNLGDIDKQTIAGAISTGTHGTGLGFGGIATQVVGATLVSGTGAVIKIGEDDPRLKAVALGLGALGVLVEVTLQCVDRFVLESVEGSAPLAQTTEGFLDTVRTADHFEFFWFPGTEVAVTKTTTRHPGDHKRKPLNPVRRFVDDRLVGTGALLGMCELGRAVPSLTPRLVTLASGLMGNRTVTDYSTNVFATDRSVRFRETEWAVPLENTTAAFEALKSTIAQRDWNITFPIEVRVAAADDLLLSTASGRESGYIAAHRYVRDPQDDYFAEVERIMIDHGGRPHWGKMHTRTAEFFREAYPRFDDFLAVREELDPDHVFVNDYLDAVLGA
ncbi:D-arabinono-1,4-lactone oxidase [Tsukamurella strandjordii]|uniref:D-arabinono-1,4-lactone oxidase n=1 Tax=Tsukamurella strandjordii TaxID=147577 RepID=A0AA90S8Z6_9ACTN|nr:D-arabinono-1,4-lactone oxidase [Tsukamurella strandjordii]MDP0399545.1 D-arabinono-1,4-lactone oxidase [Tsukamurella strandjordii]